MRSEFSRSRVLFNLDSLVYFFLNFKEVVVFYDY